MSAGAIWRGLARLIGISVIFSIVGPFAIAALVLVIVASFGAPLAQLSTTFAAHDLFSTIVSVALWVLAIAAWLAAIPPSAMAGLIFAFLSGWIAYSAAAILLLLAHFAPHIAFREGSSFPYLAPVLTAWLAIFTAAAGACTNGLRAR